MKSIINNETHFVLDLRLPTKVAQYVSTHEQEAIKFLHEWVDHHSDPDAYENAMQEPMSLLQEADELIHGQRQKDYGDKLQNFAQISMLLQGLLSPKLLPDARILPEDVALIMICVKLARASKTPDHRDSILDIAGYAGCHDLLQIERKNGYRLAGAIKDARAPE